MRLQHLLALMILCFSSKVFAISDNTANAIGLFLPGFITGAVFARNITAAAREEKYVLIERGYSSEKGSYYLAGTFINPDLLAFGRYGHEGLPLDDFEAFKTEAGARHYLKWFYGELGIFQSRHRSRDYEIISANQGYYAYSNKYRTHGVFGSLGASIQFWRLSIGFRGAFYQGFSVEAFEKSSSPQLGQEHERQARRLYNSKGNFFLDFGFSI